MKVKKVQLLALLVLSCLVMGGGVMLFAQTTQEDLSQGLVAYWKFDEGEGDIVFDEVTNTMDGTIHGATWTTGKVNSALVFDGDDDYVEIPYDAGLAVSAGVSLSVWVKPLNVNPGEIVSKRSYGGYRLAYHNKRFMLSVATETNPPTDCVSGIHESGDWHHVVGTYDGSTMTIYVDGKLEGFKGWSGDIVIRSDPLYIGRRVIGGKDGFYFNGAIDEIRIYNRALTEDEIKELYQQGQSAE